MAKSDISAVDMARAGFKIFPCFPGGKKPMTGHGFKDASASPEEAAAFWKEHPDANVGLPSGEANGIAVVDLDIDKSKGVDGISSFMRIAEPNGGFPRTFMIATPRGGMHLYFKHRAGFRSTTSSLAEGVDTRGDGGYVLVPPSKTEAGSYKVACAAELAEMPDWLFNMIVTKTRDAARTAGAGERKPESFNAVSKETIEKALSFVNPACGYQEWVQVGMALHNWNEESGFSLWNEWSKKAGDKYKDEEDLLSHWKSFSAGAGITIATLLAKAQANGWRRSGSVGVSQAILDEKFVDPQSGKEISGLAWVELCASRAELGIGDLYTSLMKGRRLYDHSAKSWMLFDDGCWRKDSVASVEHELPLLLAPLFRLTANKIQPALDAARESLAKGRASEVARVEQERRKESVKELEGRVKVLTAAEGMLCRNASLKSIAEMAGRCLHCVSEEFDADPDLLNCRNGTLRLLERRLVEGGSSELMQSKMANVEYDPSAAAPKFEMFLEKICDGNAELKTFLIQFLGYALTGRTDNDFFLYAFGIGANGKSTLFDVVKEILGDYAASIPIESLLQHAKGQQQSGTASYSLMNLKGARLAISSEIPNGSSLNESQVKDLTGGDAIIARNPYEKPVTFKPSAKLILFGNHKLEIRGGDNGIWRRVRLMPFRHIFQGEELRPRSEIVAELKKEASGILNLALSGLAQLAANNWAWRIPSVVMRATEEYKDESDNLGAFIAGCLAAQEGSSVPIAEVMDKLSTWSFASREHVGEAGSNTRKLAAALRERGLRVEKGARNTTCLFGYKIAS